LSRRGLVLFGAMCVIWGIPYLLIRVAVRELDPAELVLARTAIAALLLVPIALARRELRDAFRRPVALLAFTGIEIALPWLLLNDAEQEISSSLTALIIAAVPLVGVLLALATRSGDRFGLQSFAGLLIGLAGVAAIVGVNPEGEWLPVAEVGLVAVCYAVGPFILQRWLADLPPLGVIAASLAVTALVYAPVALFDPPGAMPSAEVVLSVLGLAVVCTAVAFLVFFALIAEVGAVRATVITYVNPAVAAVLGVIVLEEDFTAGMGLGLALVLVGSALATRPGRTPPPEPPGYPPTAAVASGGCSDGSASRTSSSSAKPSSSSRAD
jgi:drug/metabolite transporter (DMT)-like permease